MLPLPEWLRPWLAAVDGPVVAYRGRPVGKIAGSFQTLRDAAGFAYTLRHSVATELAARGVPEPEIAALLSHRMPGSRSTGRYLHVAPDRLASARAALEALAVAGVAVRPLTPPR